MNKAVGPGKQHGPCVRKVTERGRLQFGPREDLNRGQVSGLVESKVVMKNEGAVTTEGFAHDGARNLRVAIGRKGGVRGVNEPGKNRALVQAKAGAAWQREDRELRRGGAYDHRSKTDGRPAYV